MIYRERIGAGKQPTVPVFLYHNRDDRVVPFAHP
jgi:hypothetical protein